MKRNTRSTKQIVKALSIGLSASMLLQPMTAMADANDDNISDEPKKEVADEKPYVNAGDESCESTNHEGLENAKELLDVAERLEDETEDAARKLQREPSSLEEDFVLEAIAGAEDNDYPNIFAGWKDVNDSAKEFDDAAEKHVDDAKEILEEADKVLTGDPESDEKEKQTGILDEFEKEVQSSEEASKLSVEEAAKAAADMLTAEAASVSANEAASSEEAKEYAEVAKEAVEDAKANSVSANEHAANALEEYNDAVKQLEAARKAAKEANDKANKALELGLEDAEAAVIMAKAAEKTAEELEAFVNGKKEAADAYVAEINAEITRISNEINELTKNINSKKNEEKIAQGELDRAAWTLWTKLGELNAAQIASWYYAPSKEQIEKQEKDLKDLENTMKAAKEALDILKGQLDEAYGDNEAAKKALSEATEAYNEIKDAYNKAVADVAAEKERETTLNGTVSELKATYGDDIMDKQKALRDAKTPEDKTNAAKALIEYVMGAENASVITYEAIPNGIFMIQGEEKNSYFTYEIAEDGTITIKNIDADIKEAVVNKVEAEVEKDLTEAQKDELIKKLEDGSFFIKMNQQESDYIVTYRPEKYEGAKAYTDVDGERVVVECEWGWQKGQWVLGWNYKDADGKRHSVSRLDVYLIYYDFTGFENAEAWAEYAALKAEYQGYEGVKVVEKKHVTYDVTSNVNSKVVNENELGESEWLYYFKLTEAVEGTDAVYKLTSKGGKYNDAEGNHNRDYDKAPEMVGDNYRFDYHYAYDYSTDKNNLRWNSSKGRWEILGYKKNEPLVWYALDDLFTDNNMHTVGAYKHKNLTNLSEAEAKAYGYNYTLVKEATVAKPATYKVFFSKTETTPGSETYTVGSDANSFADLAAQLGAIAQAINNATGVINANQKTVDDYNDAVKAADEANKKYEKLLDEYNKASKNFDDENYQYRINNLEKQIRIATFQREAADENLAKAEKAYFEALGKWGQAYAKLTAIQGQIERLEGLKSFDKAYRAGLRFELGNAQGAAAYWSDKLTKVSALEDKAEEARIAAEKARDALKLLQNTSNVGEEAIKKAEAELALALADYEEADRLAKLATKDAEDAETAYNNILDKIEELLREEAARRSSDEGGDEGTGATVETLPEAGATLLAQAGPATFVPAAGGTVDTTTNTPEDTSNTAEPGTQLNIGDGLVPTTNGPETTVKVDDADVPLAPMTEQEKMSWWWILVVLLVGTSGAELLRRRMVRKHAASLESTNSDK